MTDAGKAVLTLRAVQSTSQNLAAAVRIRGLVTLNHQFINFTRS